MRFCSLHSVLRCLCCRDKSFPNPRQSAALPMRPPHHVHTVVATVPSKAHISWFHAVAAFKPNASSLTALSFLPHVSLIALPSLPSAAPIVPENAFIQNTNHVLITLRSYLSFVSVFLSTNGNLFSAHYHTFSIHASSFLVHP
eukprot:gb/GEZJ01006027.1/.p1 GENE.gb/GEZJ01006027.1/~~gb/GEZJ01006027.1/.p1  ORF type:complete len:143 (-),score=7.27 gb/GEZJ01006027.1/:633-1061(-)